MTKLTQKFTNLAGNVLTVVAQQGKSGFNVKASVKVSKDTKAVTVARQSVKTEAEAQETFKSINAQVAAQGWTIGAASSAKSFINIPTAEVVLVGGVKSVKAPKAEKKAKKAAKGASKKSAASQPSVN